MLLVGVSARAQSGSINAFSPYTMYGVGEINTPGTLAMRSMGGVGVAARQVGMINLGMGTAAEAKAIKSDMPFPECGAMSQGYIGYHIQQALRQSLAKRNLDVPVVTLYDIDKQRGHPSIAGMKAISEQLHKFIEKEAEQKELKALKSEMRDIKVQLEEIKRLIQTNK